MVGSDVLKMHARCPSLAYWLRATAMVPITLAALFAVRCAPACLLGMPSTRLMKFPACRWCCAGMFFCAY